MKQKLIFTLLLLFAATTATAHDFEVDGIYYNIINGNEAAVTFNGDGNDFNSNSDRYTGEVSIPETVTYDGVTYAVTAIGSKAFSGCSGLTSIVIPSSVTKIDSWAFQYCSGLTSVIFPNSVTSIGNYAFKDCSGLTNLTIGNSLTAIGEDVFGWCTNLVSITVESGNPKYDSRDNCNAIIKTASNTLITGCQNTVIPNTVTAIGDYAFHACIGLKSITIPNSVTRIGSGAFNWCRNLTSVTIPNSVKAINYLAFHFCENLTDLTIGNSVTTIGGEAFGDCENLTSLTIPKSVNSIATWAFRGCKSLKSITVESGNPKYDSRDNCNAIISTADNTLITGCQNTIIPNTVTSIASYAFSHCIGLTTINIPKSVTAIRDSGLWDCSGLTDVYSYITDLSKVTIENRAFSLWKSNDYSRRTLHVPAGTSALYQASDAWYPYFGQIVEMSEPVSEVNCDLNGDGVVNIADVNIVVNYILTHE